MTDQTCWPHFIAMQSGVVPYSEDDPGWAKTAIHRALAKQTDRLFIQIILSQKLREDIGGVPVPGKIMIDDKEYPCVSPLHMEDMVRALNQPSVVLWDEFNQPPSDVMGSAQEVINNPPPTAWMAAVGNAPEKSTCGQEFSPPVTNRLCMLKWERFNNERRAGWASGFQHYPVPTLPIVPSNFLTDFGPKWGQLLCLFEDNFPEHFGENTFPTEDDDKNQLNASGSQPGSQPWRSGRSWSNAGMLLAACEAVGGSKSTAFKLTAGCVGTGPASEFLAWIDKQDLPDPRAVLNNPQTLKLPTRFDLARAVIASVLGVVKNDNDGATWEQGFDVIEQAFMSSREIAIASLGALVNAKPKDYEPNIRSGVAIELQEIINNSHTST